VIRSSDPVVVEGARLFHEKGCEFCHAIEGSGGERGPDLSQVASRMTPLQIEARITNGSPKMPAYAKTLTPEEVRTITAFLATRR
jgi:ubiquinol-cytochrome c reductase cytochrome b subunit